MHAYSHIIAQAIRSHYSIGLLNKNALLISLKHSMLYSCKASYIVFVNSILCNQNKAQGLGSPNNTPLEEAFKRPRTYTAMFLSRITE